MKIEKTREQREAEVPIELPKDDPLNGQFFNIKEIRQGLMVWQNPVNKFTVARLHYSANPRKRTLEWKQAARAGLTWAEWMREYEIVWSSFDGVPIYGDDFARGFHVSSEPLVYAKGYPMVRGWDFGLGAGGMACVITQLLTHSRLFVYREVIASDTDIEHFAPEVNRLCSDWYPSTPKWFDIIDATGFNRSQLDKRSCAQVVNAACHTKCQPGEISVIKRRKAVSEFLQGNVKGLPKLVIDPEGCPVLVSGFEGGYHYPYAKDGQLKDAPEKNEYSHPHDALQMVCSRVKNLELTRPSGDIPATPHFNFGRNNLPPTKPRR